jgi:hypothetical protein
MKHPNEKQNSFESGDGFDTLFELSDVVSILVVIFFKCSK